jgi:hypothetical protein
MHPIAKVYERVTGRPYYTSRSMVADFGPPPAVRRQQRLAEVERRRESTEVAR